MPKGSMGAELERPNRDKHVILRIEIRRSALKSDFAPHLQVCAARVFTRQAILPEQWAGSRPPMGWMTTSARCPAEATMGELRQKGNVDGIVTRLSELVGESANPCANVTTVRS